MRAFIKAIHVYRREGMAGIKWRILALQKNAEFGDNRWRHLQPFAIRAVRAARWWNASPFAQCRAVQWLKGNTGNSKRFFDGSIRFSVDNAPTLFAVANHDFTVSGWAVDLDAHAPACVRVLVGNVAYPASLCARPDVRRAFASTGSLPEEVGFASAIRLPKAGVYRVRTQIATAGELWVTIHRALVWCRVKSVSTYNAWAIRQQKRLEAEIPEIKAHIGVMIHKPVFTVIVDASHLPQRMQHTLDSLRSQIYPHFEQCQAPADAKGEFIILLGGGQVLARDALYAFANVINTHPEADVIYADEDSISDQGVRHTPFHKPDWSPDYLETFNYVGFPVCFRASLALDCFTTHAYDLVLRVTEKTNNIRHIPKILGHHAATPIGAKPPAQEPLASDSEALLGRLRRTGRNGTVAASSLHPGCYAIAITLKRTPKVSIIIPTAGKVVKANGRHVDLIANVVRQIQEFSTYPHYEIIVVDNGDLTESQIRMLSDRGCRRVTFGDPVLNIAAKLNLGAAAAQGEMLILLNDDIEIISPAWMEGMLAHLEKPHVGAVGVKLCYPGGGFQHIGVALNSGSPDNIKRPFASRDDAGYFFSTCGVRNYLAVTGACMMTPAALYRAVGGYSEALRISYNDVDYCLKIRQCGYYSVYTPDVELIHMEAMSRAPVLNPQELEWFWRRWAGHVVSDPFYNEEFLSVLPPTFIPEINDRLV